MKRLIYIFLSCLCLFIGALFTPVWADDIYIDGELWHSFGSPINQDSVLRSRLLAALPENRVTWWEDIDGYNAYWSVQNGELCLEDIKVAFRQNNPPSYPWQSIPDSVIQRVFSNYIIDNRIVASWYSGKMFAFKGQIVWSSIHVRSNYEKEMLLSFGHGTITERQLFHNRLVTDGFSLQDNKALVERLQQFTFDTKKPELKHAERIVCHVYDIQADSLGNITDCRVEATIIYSNRKKGRKTTKGVALEIKEQFMNIHPWKTYYLNGEYVVPYLHNGIYFPLRLNNDTE